MCSFQEKKIFHVRAAGQRFEDISPLFGNTLSYLPPNVPANVSAMDV